MLTPRRISHLLTLAAAASLLLLLVPGPAPAQVRKVSTEELTRESTAIVVGKCKKTESFWNEKRTKIFTQVTLQTEERLKGDVGAETVITVPGGRVGNIIYEVSDMPTFVDGEQVLVFLWHHPSGKNLVTGALQGKMTVVEDKETGKKIVRGGPLLLRQERAKITPRSAEAPVSRKVLLDDFVKEVKKYVKP